MFCCLCPTGEIFFTFITGNVIKSPEIEENFSLGYHRKTLSPLDYLPSIPSPVPTNFGFPLILLSQRPWPPGTKEVNLPSKGKDRNTNLIKKNALGITIIYVKRIVHKNPFFLIAKYILPISEKRPPIIKSTKKTLIQYISYNNPNRLACRMLYLWWKDFPRRSQVGKHNAQIIPAGFPKESPSFPATISRDKYAKTAHRQPAPMLHFFFLSNSKD